jgi:ABC-type dipeptide/oligopeptide/nickel transport system ATPase component
MGVVAEIADRMVVMRHAHLVETGDVADVFARPRKP